MAFEQTETVRLDLDTSQFERKLEQVTLKSVDFGTKFSSALENVIFKGRDLEDQLKKLALNLASNAFNSAIAPIEKGFTQMAGQLFSSILPFAKGGVIGGGGFVSNGEQGALGFPLAGGQLGLAGEAGAEAILPLARDSNGTLGVRANTGGSGPTIVFNVTATDADSFRRSEGQMAASLSRIVARGQRNL